MTEAGLVFFKTTRGSIVAVNVSGPFEVLGLVRDTKSAGWAHFLRWPRGVAKRTATRS